MITADTIRDRAYMRLFETPLSSNLVRLLSHAAASALVSGTCSTICLQPFDFAKTRIQVASYTKRTVTSNGVCEISARPPSMIQLVSKSVQQNGLMILWRGTVPSLCRVVPGVTLYFTTLTSMQNFFLPNGRSPAMHEAAVLAFASRCFSGTCLIPMTVVKTHFESGLHERMSVIKTLRVVYQRSGVRGLFSGLGPTLARDAPFSSLYFMLYSGLKQKAMELTDQSHLTPMHLFLCGTIASCLSTLITQPADVLKTRRQMYPWERISYGFIMKDIYRSEGVQGLFRGVLPRLLRRAGMAAVSWTLFDTLKQRF